MSRFALDYMPYNETESSSTWETCTIREWLNDNFLNSAFSNTEKEVIATVTISADKNQKFDTYQGNSTQDKIFLPSAFEVSKYLTSYNDQKCQATESLILSGAYVNHYTRECDWLLRTIGETQNRITVVGDDGNEGKGINYYGTFNTYSTGIRPALWIDVSKIS